MQFTLGRQTPMQRMRHRMSDMIPGRHRASRLKRMREMAPIAGAVAAGAAAAFLFDPANGRSRRSRARTMAAGRVRGAGRVMGRAGRAVGTRAYGTTQKLRHLKQEPKIFDDATLAQKVRSEVIGRPGMRAGGIIVDAQDGCVTLRGQVKHAEDIRRLEKAVRKVPGVADVMSYLHLPETPAPNKLEALTGHRR